MTLVPCPSCGNAVSHLAEACVHCGYDLVVAPPAEATAANPRRVRRGRLMLAALAGAVGVLAVLGAFAAMAADNLRPAGFVAGSDAVGPDVVEPGFEDEVTIADVLAHLAELQQEHLAHTGTYTANLTDPAADDFLAGWSADAVPAGYSIVVIEADSTQLCVQASPDVDAPADARTLTIDEQGAVREASGCTDEVAFAPAFAES